ncbi:hypothetical protein GCM10027612_44830 [Microbispora bryophytorum subsp. camponoti]
MPHLSLVSEYTGLAFFTVWGFGRDQPRQSIGRSPPGPAEAAQDEEGKARITAAATIAEAALPCLVRTTLDPPRMPLPPPGRVSMTLCAHAIAVRERVAGTGRGDRATRRGQNRKKHALTAI